MWDQHYGGSSSDDLSSIQLTADHGYLLGGISGSAANGNKSENNMGNFQVWAVKTDSAGNVQWNKTMLTPGWDNAAYAVETYSRCYVMATNDNAGVGGYKTQTNWNAGNTTYDYWAIKFCDENAGLNSLSGVSNSCDSVINPSVELYDAGQATLYTATVFYKLDNQPYRSIAWTGALKTLDSTLITIPSISITPGNHTFKVFVKNPNGSTDDNNSNDTITFNFIVNVQPKLTLDSISFCQGSSTSLNAQNTGDSYLWSTGSTAQTITVQFQGTYAVTVTAPVGCSATASSVVTVNNLPVVSLGGPFSLCQGDTLSLDAQNHGSLYRWSNNTLTEVIHVTQSGNYSVTVTNLFGCIDSATATVAFHANPVISFADSIPKCQGNSVILNALNPGDHYIWSTADTSQSITVSSSGIYSVTVSSSFGCVASTHTSVIIHPKPVINIPGNISVCQGDTVILDAQNQGSIYNWSNTALSETIGITHTGNYSVTVTSAFGCIDSAATDVAVHANPVISFADSIPACQGNIVTLDALNVGDSYIWSNQDTSQTITASTPGNYSVKVTNIFGCVDSAHTLVIIHPTPVINIAGNITGCQGDTVILNAQNQGSTFGWSNNDSTQSIAVTGSGNYSVTVTSVYGCKSNASSAITLNPVPDFSFADSIFACQGNSVPLNAYIAGDYYVWSTQDTVPTIYVNSPGKYTVTITNSFGCKDSSTTHITFNPLPPINLSDSSINCQGDTTILNAQNPGATYLWSTNSTAGQIKVVHPGVYFVTVTNAFSCSAYDSTTVVFMPSPVVSLPANISFCRGDSSALNAQNSGDTYAWSTSSTQQVISVKQPGQYGVTVTNNFGCTANAFTDVNVYPKGEIQISDSICHGDQYNFHGIIISNPGIYADTVSSSHGCDSIVTLSLTLKPLPVQPVIVERNDSLLCTPAAGYQWYLDSIPVNNSNKPAIVIQGPGIYSVMITDSNGCSGGPVSYIVNGVKNIGDSNISLYPNPNQGDFEIDFAEGQICEFSITDVAGKKIYVNQKVKGPVHLSLPGLAQGFYFLTYNTYSSNKTLMFIIQK